jgi:ADP-ribosylglycohydrolase
LYTLLPVVIDYELKQKTEEGCQIEPLKAAFESWLEQKGCGGYEVFYAIRDKKLSIDKEDTSFLENLYEKVVTVQNGTEQNEHPMDIEVILQPAAAVSRKLDPAFSPDSEALYDQIYGGWLGRAAGCTLGKPIELWPHERVRSYLELNEAYPLEDYIPAMGTMPIGYKFKEEWRGATKGDIVGAPRDDDMDYPILNLAILDKYGPEFTTEHVGEEWLRNMPYKLVYTAERVAYKNLLNGLKPPEAGMYRNPYREWIGAQIRADVWGWVNPGRPEEAVRMAYRDGSLSHTKNGLYGELWVAAMLSLSFAEKDVEQVVTNALRYIPSQSRLHAAIEQVMDWATQLGQWEQCLQRIQEHYGAYHTVHTINNAAIVAMSLLYSQGDYERGITIAVMAGLDTDCNGATVGSVLGVMNGASRLPQKWIEPLGDSIRSLILSDRPYTLSGLAQRTLAHAQRNLAVGGNSI